MAERAVRTHIRVSKYSPTFSTNCSLRSSPSGSPASEASVLGRARRAREVLARERRRPVSYRGGVGVVVSCLSVPGGWWTKYDHFHSP